MDDIKNKKFLAYCRKSTDTEERQVRSIDDQLAELRELALKENIEIVKVYTEKQTAKAPGRPIFNEMLADIEKGVADGILAWHPDRLARNSVDGGKIIWLLDIGKLRDLKFPTFWFENTPQGKFMLQIAFGQSKYYVDNLSENIRRGIRQKLKNGLWPQMAPLGYLNGTNKAIVIDQPKASLIIKSFELYASGRYSLALLRKTINGLGLTGRTGAPMSVSNFQYLLKNPFYCGLIRYNGEIYEGRHEPIISKKLFDEVQAVMSRKSKPNKKVSKYFVFRGLIHCGECGCLVTAEMQKGHAYYRCTKRKTACSQGYVREEVLRGQINEAIEKVSLPADWAASMIAELENERATNAQSADAFAQKLRGKIVVLDAKLSRLMDGYLSGAVALEEYQVAKSKIISDKQLLKDKITAFERKGVSWFEPAIQFIKEAESASTLAKSDDNQNAREFLEKIGSNFRLAARRLDFSYAKEWCVLSENPERTNWR
jgi:DNA invertase Pin-like site-specific DNA recombinase